MPAGGSVRWGAGFENDLTRTQWGGIGVGFGLQNVVSSFVSGSILLFERPIQVGDARGGGPSQRCIAVPGTRNDPGFGPAFR